MAHMRIEWTLNRGHMLWLSLYTAILPAALLAVPLVGDWSLMVGTLVSLPLAPFAYSEPNLPAIPMETFH
jgi:hypothetical protein